jgi:two-component system, NarL family, sensor kinase
MAWLRPLTLTFRQKVFLLAAVPLILATGLIAGVVARQTTALAEREISLLENQLIAAKRTELVNYITIARTAFVNTYGRARPDDAQAKLEVMRTLAALQYGREGYFFVFDYDGTNLVAPRQTWLINRNWMNLTDAEGTPITARLIDLARTGGGFHEFLWPRPSTGEPGRMMVYVGGLQDWRWAIGTGVFIDDVLAAAATARAEVQARTRSTSLSILGISVAALLAVFLTGLWLNLHERRLADAKLKALTQRVIDTQEEERGRVARELHDSISQILVAARYAVELARRRLTLGDARAGESLDKGLATIGQAVQEVRRISRDLRPGLIDDLGLGPALQALTDAFSQRTGIKVAFETVVFRGRLDQEARIALYRIAQEALTNVERHAAASELSLSIRGYRSGVVLRVADNGRGMAPGAEARGGLGLRNMQERMEQLGGHLRILSSPTGTVIEAEVPLTHMLAVDSAPDQRKDSA